MGKQNRYRTAFLLLLPAAFLGGTAIPELIRMGTGDYSGFFSLYSFKLYERLEIRSWDLFFYILRIRMFTLLFLWMSTYTAAGILFHLVYVLWLAVSGGMLTALFVLRDGYEGVILLTCCLFPQWILYTAVIKQEAAILFRRNEAGIDHRMDRLSKRTALLYRRDLSELLGMMIWCVAGCACEAFLGTWTLKIFLQLFM